MKFNKKRIAKEIVIFWFILLPVLLVLIYSSISNFIYSNKIAAEKEYLQEYYQAKKELTKIVDISIESFENKKDSLKIIKDHKLYFETNYPELEYFTNHLDGRMFEVILQLGIPLANKDSIIETRDFWEYYVGHLEIIYKRDKAFFKKQFNIQEQYSFESSIKAKIFKVFEDSHQIEISRNKLKEFQSRLISIEDRNKIIIFTIIGYLLLVYPIRLIIVSIIWSIKTLNE